MVSAAVLKPRVPFSASLCRRVIVPCPLTIIATPEKEHSNDYQLPQIRKRRYRDETAKCTSSISTLTFDIDITVEPIVSDSPMAHAHRVLGRSPRGPLVECGGIWKKQSRDAGADYFTQTVRDHGFNANLGKAANQDDASIQAVIPWTPRDVS